MANDVLEAVHRSHQLCNFFPSQRDTVTMVSSRHRLHSWCHRPRFWCHLFRLILFFVTRQQLVEDTLTNDMHPRGFQSVPNAISSWIYHDVCFVAVPRNQTMPCGPTICRHMESYLWWIVFRCGQDDDVSVPSRFFITMCCKQTPTHGKTICHHLSSYPWWNLFPHGFDDDVTVFVKLFSHLGWLLTSWIELPFRWSTRV